MGYTIRIREQITPRNVERKNPSTGLVELRPNRGEYLAQPQSFVRLIFSPLQLDPLLIYEADPVGRTELWEDVNGTATMAEIDAACPGFRGERERGIRAAGRLRLAAIATPYSPEERETWPYQREECMAYYRDNTALTPFCDAIASQRGIPRDLFLGKVKENMDLFSVASSSILGQQQALIDQIWAADDLEAILSVKWQP